MTEYSLRPATAGGSPALAGLGLAPEGKGRSALVLHGAGAETDPGGSAVKLVDREGVEVLDHDECLRLIGSRQVGRIGIVDSAQPLIFPMNYSMVGDTVVMRTSAGTKLQHAHGSAACFEVDDVDVTTRAGWSVLALGRLETITEYDAAEVRAVRALPLSPWADGERPHWMRLVTQRLTGRRVGTGSLR